MFAGFRRAEPRFAVWCNRLAASRAGLANGDVFDKAHSRALETGAFRRRREGLSVCETIMAGIKNLTGN